MTVSHLVRRGVETLSNAESDISKYEIEIKSPWLAGLLVVTVLAFVFISYSVSSFRP